MNDGLFKEFIMQYSTPRRLSLAALGLFVLAVMATGCGNSESFVFTGNTPPADTTGNLIFNFEQQTVQQAPDIVPSTTATLRFDLFATDPPAESSFVFTETHEFQTRIVLEDVPSNCVSVLVTALDENGLPLATYSGSFEVLVGEDVVVDLNDAEPVTLEKITVSPDPMNMFYSADVPFFESFRALPDNSIIPWFQNGDVQVTIRGEFSNGSSIDLPISAATTTFSNLQGLDGRTVANVSASGLFSVANLISYDFQIGNNTTATATYTLGTIVREDDFVIQTTAFLALTGEMVDLGDSDIVSPVINPTSGYSDGWVGVVYHEDSTAEFFNETSLSFAFESDVPGLTINPDTGVITVENNDELDGSIPIFVLVTYVDPTNNHSYTARLEMRLAEDR
ncbi:MAG: hypothetical protein WC314_21580 [Vulcanimicrobiota bacterium]